MKTDKKQMKKRIIMGILGILITGLAVALQKTSQMGVDPFSVLMYGMANFLNTSYMVVFASFCVILLLITALLNRHLIGFATIFIVFFHGMVVDGCYAVLLRIFGESPSMAMRIVLFILALLVVSIASAMYYSADLGVSPYDAQALTIGEKTPVPFKFARIATDIICMTVGFLMGGDLGVATFVFAFCMGPFISFCRTKITEPILDGTFMK